MARREPFRRVTRRAGVAGFARVEHAPAGFVWVDARLPSQAYVEWCELIRSACEVPIAGAINSHPFLNLDRAALQKSCGAGDGPGHGADQLSP